MVNSVSAWNGGSTAERNLQRPSISGAVVYGAIETDVVGCALSISCLTILQYNKTGIRPDQTARPSPTDRHWNISNRDFVSKSSLGDVICKQDV